VETIKRGDEAIGSRVRAKVVKNKVAPPFKSAEFDIMFDQGVSREGSLLDLGVEIGLVKKMGAFYSFGETRLGQGRENAKDYLREHGEVAQEMERQIRGVVFSTQSFSDSDSTEL
jgi:recombination protein RecA